ncbi:MAG: type II toxin-antitoxin system VapC family toxin [Imperialibacter sp.]|uniref:type II toxin-antitoxin system VapC family toxin n=1 Tax=Imperialibacter sp. TaxID=2038411 RepID=UPI0032EDAABD
MEKKYLIDTNVIIDFTGNRLTGAPKTFVGEVIDSQPYISVINKIELLGFSVVPIEIIEFTDSSQVVGLNEEIVDLTISIRKRAKIKLPDAIIASTCILLGLTLITRNEDDFGKIEGLSLLNPWTLA